MTPEQLDRLAASQARRDARLWVAPIERLIRKAKRTDMPLERFKRELKKTQFNTKALVRGMVRSQQIAMGLGILDATREDGVGKN